MHLCGTVDLCAPSQAKLATNCWEVLTKKFKAESAARKTAVAEKASMQQKLMALEGDMQAKITALELLRDRATADAKVCCEGRDVSSTPILLTCRQRS